MIARTTLFVSTVALCPASAIAVQWETQADRLQQISATLLDGVPVPHPVKYDDVTLGLGVDISFLPKLNTTVGGKTEKVPQAKFHAVPTVEATGGMLLGKSMGLGFAAYGGVLPPMPKFVSGIEAKLLQTTYGALFDVGMLAGKQLLVFGQAGWHGTNGTVKGQIASKNGDDTFAVKTSIFHVSVGAAHEPTRLHASYQIGYRDAHSKLTIKEDDTALTLDDSLGDARVPLFSQATVGWAPAWARGTRTALSFFYVPNRLYLPRLTLAYVYSFRGERDKEIPSTVETKAVGDALPPSGTDAKPTPPATPKKSRTKPAPKPPATPAAPPVPLAAPEPGTPATTPEEP